MAEGAYDMKQLIDALSIRRLEPCVIALGVLRELCRHLRELPRSESDRMRLVNRIDQIVRLVDDDDRSFEAHSKGGACARVKKRRVRQQDQLRLRQGGACGIVRAAALRLARGGELLDVERLEQQPV